MRKKEKKMEFDKSRVYTALNADELRAGDKVFVAHNMRLLKWDVESNHNPEILEFIRDEDKSDRFAIRSRCSGENIMYPLAYLVERKENCTNCGKYEECGYMQATSRFASLNRCDDYKPKTEQKAEKHFRPFKDTDELIKVWLEKRMITYPDLTLPHIWVRLKVNFCKQKGQVITKFDDSYVSVNGDCKTMQALFNDYEFLDGSVCGVEE